MKNFFRLFSGLNIYLKTFIVISVLVGSVIRYQNLFNVGYYFDMVYTQYTWGKLAFEQGIFGFWRDFPMLRHYDYPPISLIYEYFVFALARLSGENPVEVFVLILKSVNWFFDALFCGFLIYFGYKNGTIERILKQVQGDSVLTKIVQVGKGTNGDQGIAATTTNSSFDPVSMGWFLAAFFYLSPASWFTSGVWGQNDTLIVFITLLCLLILIIPGFVKDFIPKNLQDFTRAKPVILNLFQDLFNFLRKPKTTPSATASTPSGKGNLAIKDFKEFDDLTRLLRSQEFWAGFLFAIGFWIKQQPLLLIPILGLIFIRQKSNKAIFKAIIWLLPFITIGSILALFYTEKSLEFSNPVNFFTKLFGFDYAVITNWGIITNIGMALIFVIPFAVLSYFEIKVKKITDWFYLRRFLLGFWLVSTLIAIPFAIVNYQRFARVTFAVVIRGETISNGATTFWGIFKNLKTATDIVIGNANFGLQLKHVAIILYLILVGFVVYKYLKLDLKKLKTLDFKVIFGRKLSLYQLFVIMWVHTSCYFLFFPNMHSRYLHFSIIFSLLISFYISFKNKWILILWSFGLILLNLFYTLNQILVFGVNNSNPIWPKQIVETFGNQNIDIWWWSSVGIFVSFVLMYSALILKISYDRKGTGIKNL